MGFWRTVLLGDWGNRWDISDNEGRIQRVRSEVRKNRRRSLQKDQDHDRAIEELQSEVDQLKVALGALTQLLVAKRVLGQDELERTDELLDDA